jgi:hypothetical protein
MRTFSALFLIATLLFTSPDKARQQNDIVFAPSIHQLDVLLEYDVRAWLAANHPGATNIYAVMSSSENENGIFVSLAGMTPTTSPPYRWRMEDGNIIWTGTLKRVDGQMELYNPGEQVSRVSSKLAAPSRSSLLGGVGGGPDISFPWQVGTEMQYGVRGIHGGGFSINGIGLDFIGGDDMGEASAPPMVYASADGTIVDVCEDSHSTGIKVVGGENTIAYFHLQNDASLTQGTVYSKGDPIGSLVYGSFDDTCGTAEQQPSHYHIHWVVQDNSSGNFQAEGWQLKSSDAKWHRGNETVSTGQWILGGGGSGTLTDDPGSKPRSTLVIIPGKSSSGGGSAIWDYLLVGINTIYTTFKTWYAPTNPVNADNELMWVLAMNMFKTLIKDANVYLINDTLNILPLVYVYSAMLFLEGIKWVFVITLSVLNLAKDVKGLLATS